MMTNILVEMSWAEFEFRLETHETETYPMAEWAEFVRIPNVPKCGLNTRHDNREVTLTHLTQSANFALWQIGHRLNPHERVNDYQRYSMLIVLPLRSMSCLFRNSSSL